MSESALIAALRAENFERDRPLLNPLPPMLDTGTRATWNAQARDDRCMFVIARHLMRETEFGLQHLIRDVVTLGDATLLLGRMVDAQARYRLAHATLKAAEPIVRRMVKELQQ